MRMLIRQVTVSQMVHSWPSIAAANKGIGDNIPSLYPNGEESLNKLLSPDPDPGPHNIRGGPINWCNTYCVKKPSNQSGNSF